MALTLVAATAVQRSHKQSRVAGEEKRSIRTARDISSRAAGMQAQTSLSCSMSSAVHCASLAAVSMIYVANAIPFGFRWSRPVVGVELQQGP